MRRGRITFGLLGLCASLFFASWSMAADYLLDTDPKNLESKAKYNYFLGQYYFSQGKYSDAEQYFQRSRDLMERKGEVTSHKPALSIDQAGPANNAMGEYLVGDGDVLYITVWQNNDLDQEVIVRPDGRLSFPLVGDIMASGRTLTQIDEELTSRLKEFIKFPEVSVSIRRLGGSKVVILGEVYRPGVYVVSGNRSILEAIALAGGFTNDAVANSVILIRGGLQKPGEPRRLNLRQAMLGKAPDANISIQPEDIIYVPKTFISNLAYIVTQIVDPIHRGTMNAQSFMAVMGKSSSS